MPRPRHRRHRSPAVVDDDVDVFGAEAAAAHLTERLEEVRRSASGVAGGASPGLRPPFAPTRDRVDGPASARTTLLVFGAFGAPSARSLGKVLATARERHFTTVAVAWLHYPDPSAHPRAAVIALAAEAAAARGKFWFFTHAMLRLRHDDPADLHTALLRAGLDPRHTLEAMRAGTGAERIADDVASALASGVERAPTLFVNGERYRGELDPDAVSAGIQLVLTRL
jgi:2-hydroxychromene-2-carboxylate isomerase